MGAGAAVAAKSLSRLPQLPWGLSGPVSPVTSAGSDSVPSPAPAPLCRFGACCYNWDPEHRRRFQHPSGPSGLDGVYRACKYGPWCNETSVTHLQLFAHPGDRSYRHGLVLFGEGQKPEFETLWQLFSYFDQEESGHLKREDFELLLKSQLVSPDAGLVENCWCDAGGESSGSVSFTRFAPWAEAYPIGLPVGLDITGESRPCRCLVCSNEHSDFRCKCSDYRPEVNSILCECGHKASMHRSDAAEGSFAKLAQQVGWASEGLAVVEDSNVLQALQDMLDRTHKAADNWTRDRGCSIHGVNGVGCSLACAFKNQVPVPKGYILRKAYRNQNTPLWARYSIARSFIAKECAREPAAELLTVAPDTRGALLPPLEPACNEWRLFHGTRMTCAKDICNLNFRPVLAGSGATWKATGEERGSPLYGLGMYFAERITKADEYAHPFSHDELGDGICAMLVVRCVGGRAQLVTTNDIQPEALRRSIFDGPHHSVLGDRVASLRKPYREIVIYDRDQCFPEFLLLYERHF